MDQLLTQVPPTQLGVLLLMAIVLYKALDIVKTLVLSKLMPNTLSQDAFPCQRDPAYSQRLREIHDYTKTVGLQIAHGDFACQWKDREEVRDYIDVAKSQVTAMQSVVNELQLLRRELVITRNGRGAQE